MEVLSAVTNYISEFEYEHGVTPFSNYTVPLTIGACYLVGVYLLRAFMENRERIPAKGVSLVHNFNMYAISIICFTGITYGVLKTLWVRRTFSPARGFATRAFLMLFVALSWPFSATIPCCPPVPAEHRPQQAP